jgi:FtsH-binding integral membrane protein
MRKLAVWIVIGLIVAFVVGMEIYKEGGKAPWAFVFAGVVVFFVYSFTRRR